MVVSTVLLHNVPSQQQAMLTRQPLQRTSMQSFVVLDFVSLIENTISPHECLLEPCCFSSEDLISRDHDVEVCYVSLGIGASLDEGTFGGGAMQADDSEVRCPLPCLITPGLKHAERANNEIWSSHPGCCRMVFLQKLDER